MRNNNLGYRETERGYKIHHSVLARWERIYLEEGYVKERKLFGQQCNGKFLWNIKGGNVLWGNFSICG